MEPIAGNPMAGNPMAGTPSAMSLSHAGPLSDGDGTEFTDRTSFTVDESELQLNIFELGRRYQAYRVGRYPLPNDEREQNREEIQNQLFCELMEGRLFVAPLPQSPNKVLDLGTGIGLWCNDMGDAYPEADILGVDLSYIQPSLVAPNVRFEIDDIEDEWSYDDDFDLIHMREVSFFLQDLPKLLERAYKHLKPGGWMETMDCDQAIDGTAPEGFPWATMEKACRNYARSKNLTFNIFSHIGELMTAAGFVNVRSKIFKIPLGWVPGDKHMQTVRRYFAASLDCTTEHFAPILIQGGMSPEQVMAMNVGMQQVLNDEYPEDVHCSQTITIWYGQKPQNNSA